MKYYYLAIIPFILLCSCSLKDQTDKLQALKSCTYEIVDVDSVYLAETNVTSLINAKAFNLAAAPGLGLAFMRQDLPLRGVLRVKITNPGSEVAGINGFEYKVFLRNTELTSGVVSQEVNVKPGGGSFILPVPVNQNVFPLLTEPANQKAITDFFNTNAEKKVTITFKIKPAILIGNEKIYYPGYIDINKEVTNKELVNYMKEPN